MNPDSAGDPRSSHTLCEVKRWAQGCPSCSKMLWFPEGSLISAPGSFLSHRTPFEGHSVLAFCRRTLQGLTTVRGGRPRANRWHCPEPHQSGKSCHGPAGSAAGERGPGPSLCSPAASVPAGLRLQSRPRSTVRGSSEHGPWVRSPKQSGFPLPEQIVNTFQQPCGARPACEKANNHIVTRSRPPGTEEKEHKSPLQGPCLARCQGPCAQGAWRPSAVCRLTPPCPGISHSKAGAVGGAASAARGLSRTHPQREADSAGQGLGSGGKSFFSRLFGWKEEEKRFKKDPH